MLRALLPRLGSPRRTLSIRSYLVFLPLVTAAPLVIFAALLVLAQARSASADRERALRETTGALAVAVDEYLTGALNTLRMLGTSRFFDLTGPASGGEPLRGADAFREQVAQLLAAQEGWRSVLVVSRDGRIAASAGPVPALEDMAERTRPLVHWILAAGVPAVSAVLPRLSVAQGAERDAGSSEATAPEDLRFAAGLPVGRAGEVRYVIVAVLDASGLARILHSQPLPEHWSAILVDGAGRIVPRSPREGAQGAVETAAALLAQTGAETGWHRGVSRDGVPSYLAFQRGHTSSWGVGIAVPAALVDGPYRRSLLIVLTGGLLCLVSGAWLAAVLGRQLAEPLTALAAAAHSIEQGPRPIAVPGSMVREISVLGQSLQRAARAVQERAVALGQADAAVRESRAWHAALAAFAPVGLVRTDPEGRATYVNYRWTQVTGLTLEQARDGQWVDHLLPEDRDQVLAEWERTRQSGSEFYAEFRLREPREGGPSGDRWLAGYARPVNDANGQVAEYIGVAMDITDRKRAEAERAELAARAEAARLEAEAANRAKDDFLSALSHELRTPLNAMLLWLEVLRERGTDADLSARAVDAIDRSARLQARLVEDLLDVARISSGRFAIDPRPMDLVAVVRAAADGAAEHAAAKQISMATEMAVPTCPMFGDPERLQQVIASVLSNAIRFSPKGGRIEVALRRDGEAVTVLVRDSGEGIAPEFMGRLFERFRQAEGGARRRHGGLGLSLAIARDIVELHGGRIAAASDGPGKGACFTITLPVTHRETPALAAAAPGPAAIASSGHPRLDGLVILLVEDHEESRELVSRALGRLGARVVAVASAAEALAAIQRVRPHAMVSDIGMAGTDGYELMRRIRAEESEGASGISAVALTGYASAGDREQALAAGYQAHVAKPVDTRHLAEVIAGLVKRG